MSQMKEQDKAPGKDLNKMEASNPPDAEFETLVIRLLSELREGIDGLSGNFSKDRNHKKRRQKTEKDQSEMNTIIVMKNTGNQQYIR